MFASSKLVPFGQNYKCHSITVKHINSFANSWKGQFAKFGKKFVRKSRWKIKDNNFVDTVILVFYHFWLFITKLYLVLYCLHVLPGTEKDCHDEDNGDHPLQQLVICQLQLVGRLDSVSQTHPEKHIQWEMRTLNTPTSSRKIIFWQLAIGK